MNILLKKIHMPPLIGYIFTGTIITYIFGLHDAVDNKELKEIAEFGVVFLMFTIGLELSFNSLKSIKYEVFALGNLQILITGLITFAVTHWLLKLDLNSSIVISMAIPLSSTAIVLKSFNESGEISKRHGRNVLGILIMQDIAVIPILLIIWFLSTNGTGGESTAIVISKMVVGAMVLIGILWLFGKYLLEPFLTAIVKTKSDEVFVTAILAIAIGASQLAHSFEFSYSLGAFIAGMLIAETKYKHQVETDLVPFRDLLLGIFFITVGMQIHIQTLIDNLHIVLTILPVVFILKFGVIFGVSRLKSNYKTSLKTALSLVQIGEFSLAVLELSGTSNLIPHEYSQILIATVVISMILTPLILMKMGIFVDQLLEGKEQFFIEHDHHESFANSEIVILGYGEFGQTLSKTLRKNGVLYTIIENNIDTYHKGVELGEPIIFGNGAKKSIFKIALTDEIKKVVVAIDNPKKVYQTCDTIAQLVDKEKIIVKVHSQHEKELLSDLEITNIIVENRVVSEEVLKRLEE
jgi:CPA2 family monovalent cation:H+ antiporter-2